MVYGRRISNEFLRLGGVVSTSGARGNIGLNAAYVNRTSGPAVGIRVRCETSEPINEVYVFNDVTTGTRANVLLRADVYNWTTAATSQPGTTLLASSDNATLPASDDRWVRLTFSTPYTPTTGEYVFIVVHNVGATPTVDFAGIQNDSNANSPVTYHGLAPFSATNGFNTAGTSRSELPHIIVQGSSTIYGNPISSSSSISSFVGRRGILFSDEIKRFRSGFWRISSAASALSRLQIFDLSTPPGGTPLYDRVLTATEAITGIVWMDFDLSTLPGNGPFVLCAATSATAAYGSLGIIEGYSDFPAIFDAISIDNFANPPVVTEVAGNWVVDRSRLYGMFMEVYDVVTPSGSSGIPLGRIISGGV
ncbi:MAG: hypothetical protein ACK506_16160 [Pirellula sp.]